MSKMSILKRKYKGKKKYKGGNIYREIGQKKLTFSDYRHLILVFN
jgi:hypothetical protein